MRHAFIFLALIAVVGCFPFDNYFDRAFYEKTSGIKFPKDIKVLETIDNGEFVTATVFQVDHDTLLQFVKLNSFDTLKPSGVLTL